MSTASYKVANHAHSSNSMFDPSAVTPLRSAIENHYAKGFDVLAVTDHNILTRDWITPANGLTRERFDEIAAGVDRNGRKMLQVPDTNERSWYHDDTNTFLVNANSTGTIHELLAQVETLNGFAHFNHPGRYTGAQFNASASRDPANIGKYVGLFMVYPRAVGMEIINRKDVESANDRILWDNISTETIPYGRFVWGFSNDDSHRNQEIGFSFNMFMMPENTVAAFREAIAEGSFYAVARVAHNEGINNPDLNAQTPIIKDIVRNVGTITIVADYYNRIDWITENTVTVAQGNTLALSLVAGRAFVRANVIGSGGIAFTQPFAL